jgi:3-hydroxybutyryl-CoA dehydrogenase
MDIKTVGIVGSGTMGNGIAQAFAQSGYEVILYDVAEDALQKARNTIDKSLAKFVEKGKVQAADRTAALERITTTTGIDQLSRADYVVEAIFEHAETKRSLFQQLDTIVAPHVILASNTSSIPITLLGAATKKRASKLPTIRASSPTVCCCR